MRRTLVSFALGIILGAGATIGLVYFLPGGPAKQLKRARIELAVSRQYVSDARKRSLELESGIRKAIDRAAIISSASDRIILLARTIREVAEELRAIYASPATFD